MPNSLKCRLKNLVRNGLLREKDLERIIIIPPNATNGDVIKAIFPSIHVIEVFPKVHLFINNNMVARIDINMWNANYKR